MPSVAPDRSAPMLVCHPPARMFATSSGRCRARPRISAQVSSVGGVGLDSVPQTVTPRAFAAARSMEALRIPLVTRSFSFGRRASRSAGKGVRSRMITRISASAIRATSASRRRYTP